MVKHGLQRWMMVPLLAGLLAGCGGSSSDDDPQQFDAGDMVGTWLMSAEFTFNVDDPSLAGEGAETMRTVVTISSDDAQHATIRNCYPGVASQEVTVQDNQFEYQLFDAPLVFTLVPEGVDAPRIDLVSGDILLPGPPTMRKVRADAQIDSSSGEVTMLGKAHLVRVSAGIVRLTEASVTFAGEAAVELDLQCFTEIRQWRRLSGELGKKHVQRVLAEGFEDDTVLGIEVDLLELESASTALMEFSDRQRTVLMRNTETLPRNLFVTDGASLSFVLPMNNGSESADVAVQFSPQADESGELE